MMNLPNEAPDSAKPEAIPFPQMIDLANELFKGSRGMTKEEAESLNACLEKKSVKYRFVEEGKLDRKSWALGFDDGLDEALRIIEEGIYRYDEERERLVDAINKLKGKSNGQ